MRGTVAKAIRREAAYLRQYSKNSEKGICNRMKRIFKQSHQKIWMIRNEVHINYFAPSDGRTAEKFQKVKTIERAQEIVKKFTPPAKGDCQIRYAIWFNEHGTPFAVIGDPDQLKRDQQPKPKKVPGKRKPAPRPAKHDSPYPTGSFGAREGLESQNERA